MHLETLSSKLNIEAYIQVVGEGLWGAAEAIESGAILALQGLHHHGVPLDGVLVWVGPGALERDSAVGVVKKN